MQSRSVVRQIWWSGELAEHFSPWLHLATHSTPANIPSILLTAAAENSFKKCLLCSSNPLYAFSSLSVSPSLTSCPQFPVTFTWSIHWLLLGRCLASFSLSLRSLSPPHYPHNHRFHHFLPRNFHPHYISIILILNILMSSPSSSNSFSLSSSPS